MDIRRFNQAKNSTLVERSVLCHSSFSLWYIPVTLYGFTTPCLPWCCDSSVMDYSSLRQNITNLLSYAFMFLGLVYPARPLQPKEAWDSFLSLPLFLLKKWDLIKITQDGTNPECPFPPILNNSCKGKFNCLYLVCILWSSEHAHSCCNYLI